MQLMLRFQNGEKSAFEELVHRNTGKIHALVFRFLGDQDQLEDLTQEVFMRVYRTANRYQPKAKFTTWLYRITANLCFNVLRRKRRAHPVRLDVGDASDGEGYHREVPDERARAPSAPMDEAELSQRVAQAVADLPDNQRIAIVLNKYQNMSYEDIAEVLECTTMAVKSLLSRARANLRGALERYLRHG